MRLSHDGDSMLPTFRKHMNNCAEHTIGRSKAANRVGFESLLSDLTTTFIKLTPAEIDAEIERGLQRICKFVRADRCGLAEFVEQEGLFRATHSGLLQGAPQALPFYETVQFPWVAGEVLAGKIVRFSRPDDLPAQASVDRESLARLGVKSHVSVPITVGGTIIGMLGCTTTRSHRAWPYEIVQRLQVIGEVLANALARKRARQRIDELLRFETLLSDLSAAFINLPSAKVSREIEHGLQEIILLLGLDRATLMEFSEDGSQLHVTHSCGGTGVQPLPSGLILSDQVPWAATLYQRGDVMMFERMPDDLPPKAVAEKEFCLREGIKSLIGIPLNTRGSTIGALALTSMHSHRTWPAELVQRLRLVGEIFASALMHRRTEEALVKSEQQMHLITDALPVLIAYIDTERRYRFNNVAYEKWFGLPREQIQGRTMKEVLGAEAYEVFKDYADRFLAGERGHFETEARYRGDSPRQVSGTYVPHVDEAGNVLGFYVLIQDISERKRAEAEVAQLREKLAYMARITSMGEFAASLAHELNQPLAAILSNAQAALRFLEQSPPDLPEVREALDDVVADDKRAGEVIRRLRSLFKGGKAHRAPLDINEVIEQVAS